MGTRADVEVAEREESRGRHRRRAHEVWRDGKGLPRHPGVRSPRRDAALARWIFEPPARWLSSAWLRTEKPF